MNEDYQETPNVYDVEKGLLDRFKKLKIDHPAGTLPRSIQGRILGLENFVEREEMGRMHLAFSGDPAMDAIVHGDTLREYTLEFARRLDEAEMMIAQLKKEGEQHEQI